MFIRTEYKPNQYWSDNYPHKVVYRWVEPTNDWDGIQECVEIHTNQDYQRWTKCLTRKELRARQTGLANYYSAANLIDVMNNRTTAIVSWTVVKPRQQKKKND